MVMAHGWQEGPRWLMTPALPRASACARLRRRQHSSVRCRLTIRRSYRTAAAGKLAFSIDGHREPGEGWPMKMLSTYLNQRGLTMIVASLATCWFLSSPEVGSAA